MRDDLRFKKACLRLTLRAAKGEHEQIVSWLQVQAARLRKEIAALKKGK